MEPDHRRAAPLGGLFAQPEPLPKARSTDPTTSHLAAASVQHLPESRQAVLRVFTDAAREHDVRAMTDEELVLAYTHHEYQPRQSESGIRTRRRELADAGYLVDTGQRGRTTSGRSSIMWGLARPPR